MLLPALPRMMGMLQNADSQARFPVELNRNRLPAARMIGISCPMFLRGAARRNARAGCHLCDCIAFSSPEEWEVAHRLPRGEARVYACGRTSSTKPLNGGVPVIEDQRTGETLRRKRFTFVATSFQNATISRRPCALDYGQSSWKHTEGINTNFLNTMNLTRNVTSSSVNATPFPVVLRKRARGGVGDRVLPFSLSSWARRRAATIVPGPGAFGGLVWISSVSMLATPLPPPRRSWPGDGDLSTIV